MPKYTIKMLFYVTSLLVSVFFILHQCTQRKKRIE